MEKLAILSVFLILFFPITEAVECVVGVPEMMRVFDCSKNTKECFKFVCKSSGSVLKQSQNCQEESCHGAASPITKGCGGSCTEADDLCKSHRGEGTCHTCHGDGCNSANKLTLAPFFVGFLLLLIPHL